MVNFTISKCNAKTSGGKGSLKLYTTIDKTLNNWATNTYYFVVEKKNSDGSYQEPVKNIASVGSAIDNDPYYWKADELEIGTWRVSLSDGNGKNPKQEFTIEYNEETSITINETGFAADHKAISPDGNRMVVGFEESETIKIYKKNDSGVWAEEASFASWVTSPGNQYTGSWSTSYYNEHTGVALSSQNSMELIFNWNHDATELYVSSNYGRARIFGVQKRVHVMQKYKLSAGSWTNGGNSGRIASQNEIIYDTKRISFQLEDRREFVENGPPQTSEPFDYSHSTNSRGVRRIEVSVIGSTAVNAYELDTAYWHHLNTDTADENGRYHSETTTKFVKRLWIRVSDTNTPPNYKDYIITAAASEVSLNSGTYEAPWNMSIDPEQFDISKDGRFLLIATRGWPGTSSGGWAFGRIRLLELGANGIVHKKTISGQSENNYLGSYASIGRIFEDGGKEYIYFSYSSKKYGEWGVTIVKYNITDDTMVDMTLLCSKYASFNYNTNDLVIGTKKENSDAAGTKGTVKFLKFNDTFDHTSSDLSDAWDETFLPNTLSPGERFGGYIKMARNTDEENQISITENDGKVVLLYEESAQAITIALDSTTLSVGGTDTTVTGTINNIDPNGNNAAISVSVTGGSGTYSTYAWTGPSNYTANTEDLSGLSSGGDYTLTVTDSAGAAKAATFKVIALGEVVDSYDGGSGNGQITITPSGGTAPYTYVWSEGTPVTGGSPTWTEYTTTSITTNGATGTATSLNQDKVYQITVTDADGNVAQTTIPMYGVLSISISATNTQTIAGYNKHIIDGNVILTATVEGGSDDFTYTWEKGDAVVTEQTTATFSGITQSGGYTVKVRDNQTETNLNVNLPLYSQVDVTLSGQQPSAHGLSDGILTATGAAGSGNYEYSWDGGNTYADSNTNTTGAGNHTVYVRDKTTGDTDSATFQLSQPAEIVEEVVVTPITLSFDTIGNVSRYDGNDGFLQVAVTPIGSYTYQWYKNNVLMDGQTNPAITNLSAGVYKVVVTDEYEQRAEAVQEITQPAAAPPPVTVSLNTKTNVTTAGGDGSITLTVGGGNGTYSYAWTGTNSYSSNAAAPANFPAGTYSVTVTSGTQNATLNDITIYDPLVVTYTKTNVSTTGGKNGSITLNVSGGKGPYSFAWTPPAPGRSRWRVGLSAGTYSVTVTDSESSPQTVTLNDINIYEPLTVTSREIREGGSGAFSQFSVNWTGGAEGAHQYLVTYYSTATIADDGTINLNNDQGVIPAFLGLGGWSTEPERNITFDVGHNPGYYSISIKDSEGTQLDNAGKFWVVAPGLRIVQNHARPPTSYNGNDGTIDITASGGYLADGESYTYSWSGPNNFTSTTEDLTNLSAGTYTVTVTDTAITSDGGSGKIHHDYAGSSTTYSVTLTNPAAQASMFSLEKFYDYVSKTASFILINNSCSSNCNVGVVITKGTETTTELLNTTTSNIAQGDDEDAVGRYEVSSIEVGETVSITVTFNDSSILETNCTIEEEEKKKIEQKEKLKPTHAPYSNWKDVFGSEIPIEVRRWGSEFMIRALDMGSNGGGQVNNRQAREIAAIRQSTADQSTTEEDREDEEITSGGNDDN